MTEKSMQHRRDEILRTAIERLSPQPKMAAIISVHGMRIATYPLHADSYNEIRRHEDRIAATSAAMFSLGERIGNELVLGDLRETIIHGSNGILIMLAMEQWVFTTRFTSIPSLDDMRSQLHNAVKEIAQQLSDIN